MLCLGGSQSPAARAQTAGIGGWSVMSAGIRVHASGSELEAVVYAGGWADIQYLRGSDDQFVAEHVELNDVEEIGPLLDRVVNHLVAAG